MFSTWARLSLITTSLIGIIVLLTKVSVDLLDSYVAVRTQTTTMQVAENIRMVIESHVRVLQALAEMEATAPSAPSMGGERMGVAIVDSYPGFYAINWVDERGVIRRVYPVEKNRMALGLDLSVHPDVKDRLALSREKQVPVIAPRIRTTQGIDAATLYIPVIGPRGVKGWVNAVLDIQGLMQEYLKSRHEEGLSLILRWKSHPEDVYRFGPPVNDGPTYGLETRILNEVVRIDIQLREIAQLENRRWIGWLLLTTGILMSALFVFLLRGLYLSMRELRHANQRLSLKNALISSLTHDLGNPLTTLLISVERLDVERRFDENVWGRLKKATQTLRSMVASVKFMHAVETGNASLHLASVSLSHAVSEALELVRGSLEAKGIQVVNEIEGLDLKVRADESTLVNNVLPNLLSNAIKFSVPGGKIYFRGRQTANETLLVIQDDGVGIPKEILKDFFDGGTILSRVGTSGEMGSGLGMLQVKTFMDLYHARIRMKSKTAEESGETGTRVTLIFQAVKESTEPKEKL